MHVRECDPDGHLQPRAVTTAGATVTIATTPNSSGSIANTASVSATTLDANPANNSATATSGVASAGGADLGVTTAVAVKVTEGTAFSVVLTVTNHGPN